MSEAITANEQTAPQTPAWFYRFFVGYTIYTLISLGLLYADFFRDLSAPDPNWNSPLYRLILGFVIVPADLIVGLLIVRRTHRNVTGLFLIMHAAAIMASTLRVDSPLQVLSNVFNDTWLGLWLLPLYFPDGDVYPTRFRRLGRLYTILMATLFAGVTLFTPTIEIWLGSGEVYTAPNPLLIVDPNSLIAQIVGTLQGLTWITTVLWIIPAIILRFRASRGLVRQQLKWFVYGFAVFIVMFLILLSRPGFASGEMQIEDWGPWFPLLFVFSGIIMPVMPFTVVGFAILRHRLYDIDVIIRRTLIYSVITAILAAIYFGVVTLLQTLLADVLGGEGTLSIVISTLAIAALFNPVRRRVQQFVDRRFYRQKYDAAHTLDAFAAAMRDEVDLDRIRADLITVVDDTLQPESLSLWLPPDALTRRKSS